MPITTAEIRRLEGVADRAWPAAEVLPHDGWELRATGPGIGRRVNSVAPLAAGLLPLEEKVRAAEAFYCERGLAPTFKLTGAAEPPCLDEFLGGRGYRVDAPVLIMTRSVGPPAGTPPDLPGAPPAGWLEANAAVPGHYPGAPGAFLDLVGRIVPPAAFASERRDGRVAAVGMAVADGEWVGLFEIGTRPEYRRLGLARRVVERLVTWGCGRGARTVYLQVVGANAPARALYAGLGFVEAYRYWYRARS